MKESGLQIFVQNDDKKLLTFCCEYDIIFRWLVVGNRITRAKDIVNFLTRADVILQKIVS